jgi:catechol 2,3-dioxygenase-like lactoylglutathione lyase family enzyme
MPAFPSRRRLDHLVLPARDLDAQAAFYQRLGFQVGARNVHPWGTENRLVQFDRGFLELITLGDTSVPPAASARFFSFGNHVRDWLAREGDGMSMLACDSTDAQADAQWLNQAGIAEFEPFWFGRKGQRPDGTPMEVAFSLAFATPVVMPNLCFFLCQQHNPENFWNPAYQAHENTATGVSRVVVVRDNPSEAASFLSRWLGGSTRHDAGGVTMQTAKGDLSVWTPEAATSEFGADPVLFSGRDARFAGIVFAVRRLASLTQCLLANNVPHRREGRRVVVPSGAAFGVLLAFEEHLEDQPGAGDLAAMTLASRRDGGQSQS